MGLFDIPESFGTTKHAKAGVYCLRNTANKKVYVGSAKNLYNRWMIHTSDIRLNKHHSQYLQRSVAKHGPDNFNWELLEQIENVDELLVKEAAWAEKLKALDPEYGYNMQPIDLNGVIHVADGTKRKISEANTGSKHPSAKLTEDLVKIIKQRLAAGDTCRAIGADLNVHTQTISDIKTYKTWTHVAIEGAKNKQIVGTASGADHGMAKLTEAKAMQAIEWLAAGMTCKAVAKKLHVSQGTISDIRCGKAWAHLARPQMPDPMANRRSITEEQAMRCIELSSTGLTDKVVANEVGTTVDTVGRIRRCEAWKHLPRPVGLSSKRRGLSIETVADTDQRIETLAES